MIRKINYKITALILANLLLLPIAKEVYGSDYLRIAYLSANPPTISQGDSSTIITLLNSHLEWGGEEGGVHVTGTPVVTINIVERDLNSACTYSYLGPIGMKREWRLVWEYDPFEGWIHSWQWVFLYYYQDNSYRFEALWDGRDKDNNPVKMGEYPFTAVAQIPPFSFMRDSKEGKITVTAITIDVEATPREVKPGQEALITVTAKDGANKPVPNLMILLTAEPEDKSGGHNHNTNRPVGRFGHTSGTTDSNGQFKTTYTASAFGGIEVIKASSADPPASGEYKLKVRIPDLVALGSGVGYVLTGSTPAHPNNHYGKPSVNTCLKTIASVFTTTYLGQILMYNDMSLEWGGLFDIGPPYGQFWHIPHKFHREGRNADVDDVTTGGKDVNKKWLKKIVTQDLKGSFLYHAGHFHLTF
ncbi:Ig-like domain-containing protein [bacterium]|nr:Ig-like domain-containing protein [bacterium]